MGLALAGPRKEEGEGNEEEWLAALECEWPCRETQIRALGALVHPSRPSPSTLVLHGPTGTAKTGLVTSYLSRTSLSHAVLKCREYVTGRHLLERTVGAVREALVEEEGGELGLTGRCENLAVLVVRLQELLARRTPLGKKFVLVFDGVDAVREAPPTLLPALARLGEFIPDLTTILIVQHPPPRFLHASGIPHLSFPPYTRTQAIHVLSQNPPDIFPSSDPNRESEDYDEAEHAEDKAWLWPRFCAAVWDSLAQTAARDLVAFRETCLRLWRPFVAPVVSGAFGTRDFSRLVVAQRRLFQDERVLLETIVAEPPEGEGQSSWVDKGVGSSILKEPKKGHDALPYYAQWLLIAAYLASVNPARLDAIFFMKTTERKKRKKGGPGARGGRAGQTRKTPRHLLAASAFSLDRLLAILHAILPHHLRSTIDLYTQVATLSTLRLLVRSGGMGAADPLEAGGKWRVGALVTWEYVLGIARTLEFDLVGFVAE